MVFSGFVTAWRFATCPARRSPLFANPTTDGVVRPPSWFGITTGCPPSITATTELVVPRSIPIILLIMKNPPYRTNPNVSARMQESHLACSHYEILVCSCQEEMMDQ